MFKKLLLTVLMLVPIGSFAQEPKRVNVASAPAARYQIIEASYGRNFSIASERDGNESTVIILLDSQTGQTWRYFDVTIDGEWKMGWIAISELEMKKPLQNKDSGE